MKGGSVWRHELRMFVAAMVVSMAMKGTGIGVGTKAQEDPLPWWAVPLIGVCGYVMPGALVGSLVGQVLPLQFGGGVPTAKETGA